MKISHHIVLGQQKPFNTTLFQNQFTLVCNMLCNINAIWVWFDLIYPLIFQQTNYISFYVRMSSCMTVHWKIGETQYFQCNLGIISKHRHHENERKPCCKLVLLLRLESFMCGEPISNNIKFWCIRANAGVKLKSVCCMVGTYGCVLSPCFNPKRMPVYPHIAIL